MTSDVAWVLHKAGFYLLLSCRQYFKFSDVSDLQSPIDGGKAVMMTVSNVVWIIQMASLTLDFRVRKVECL